MQEGTQEKRSLRKSTNRRAGRNTHSKPPQPGAPTKRSRGERTYFRLSDPLPHVSGTLTNISLGQIIGYRNPDDLRSMMEEMLNLIELHPDFIDTDWDPETTKFTDLVRFIEDEFFQLFGQHGQVFIRTSEASQPEFYWIEVLEDSLEFGNIIPFEWMDLIKESDPELYLLTGKFLNFIHHHLRIPSWNDYNGNFFLDELNCRLDDDDPDLEEEFGDLSSIKESFDEWNRAIANYNKFVDGKISISHFKRFLNQFSSNKPFHQDLVQWYSRSIDLVKSKISFPHFENIPLTQDDVYSRNYFNNGEVWPSSYCGFTWSLYGYVGDTIDEELSDQVGNCVIIPLIEYEQITEATISGPPVFGKAKMFYSWMSEGNELCRSFFDYLKIEK